MSRVKLETSVPLPPAQYTVHRDNAPSKQLGSVTSAASKLLCSTAASAISAICGHMSSTNLQEYSEYLARFISHQRLLQSTPSS